MECALCRKEAELKQSHIIPSLVYKRIRESKKSRFRSLSNITQIMQNGEKHPMLCHDCEELFSSFEVKFASKFLDEFLKSNRIPHIKDRWLDDYILSVAWRILYDDLYRMKSFEDRTEREMFEIFCDELGRYFLELENSSSNMSSSQFKNTIFRLKDLIKDKSINEVSKGALFGYAIHIAEANLFAVIVYYAGLVFVTEYNVDNSQLLIIGQHPFLFLKYAKKKAIKKELELRFLEMKSQYEKNMTSELYAKIQQYYEKS